MMPPHKDALQRTAAPLGCRPVRKNFDATVAAGAPRRHSSLSLVLYMAAESGAVPPQTPETTNKTNNRTFAATHCVAALLENRRLWLGLGPLGDYLQEVSCE